MNACPNCGREMGTDFALCPYCGTRLATRRPEREQRKVVTVVFCDVTGSTALGESADPEAVRTLLARYFERMKGIVERHGGTVEKFVGDAVMAVFGVPVVHEDDALRAVRAAVEMREALPELGVQARIGVNTGEVVTGTEERLATGDAVNVAARLEQAAAPGEVVVGQGDACGRPRGSRARLAADESPDLLSCADELGCLRGRQRLARLGAYLGDEGAQQSASGPRVAGRDVSLNLPDLVGKAYTRAEARYLAEQDVEQRRSIENRLGEGSRARFERRTALVGGANGVRPRA